MQKAKTNLEIQIILNRVEYKNWEVVFREEGARPYLQIQFMAPDCITGEMEKQYCRKWMLSRFMTDSEIVRTAYKAIEAAVLHELEEEFKFSGEPVYRPHFDVYALRDLSKAGRIDKRA